MTPAEIEQRIRERADVLVLDRRRLRQAIKQHRRVRGLVPHLGSYALPRRELDALPVAEGLVLPVGGQDRPVILVPQTAHAKKAKEAELCRVRAAYHALLHVELEARVRRGELGPTEVRQRIDALGRTEFEEIRGILAHDDLLFCADDDVEVYVEFAATYLELERFAPNLLLPTFPGLLDPAHVEAVLLLDVDPDALLGEEAPTSSRSSTRGSLAPVRSRSSPRASKASEPVRAQRHDEQAFARAFRDAESALRRSQHARALTCAGRAARQARGSSDKDRADELASRAAQALSARLMIATSTVGLHEKQKELVSLIQSLASAAVCARSRSQKQRQVLFLLERAALAFERPGRAVQLSTWLLSLGRAPLVRSRELTRELDVYRILKLASEWVRGLARHDDHASATTLLCLLTNSAEAGARSALRPELEAALASVGLAPSTPPSRIYRDKLVDELLDRVLAYGYLSLPQLRDAVSRNELKLPDLARGRELVEGDRLLLADAELAHRLAGIYRRGDVYLRLLQKASTLAFGTRIGRGLTIYFVLPLLGSFTVLEGVRQILNMALKPLDVRPLAPFEDVTFVAGAAFILALIKSEGFRVVARQGLDIVGFVLASLFFRLPRAALTQPSVVRFLERPVVRLAFRQGLLPLLVGSLVFVLSPLKTYDTYLGLGTALFVFVAVSAFMGSRFGFWFEDHVFDQLAPTWRALSRQWMPALFEVVAQVFRALLETIERSTFRVGEALRLRRRSSFGYLVLAGTLGAIWSAFAYVVRVYITLLVEPEINPIKHFPVVTVAHKLLLPFLPWLLALIEPPFLLIPLLGAPLAWLTVFLLPSVFGFLVWELKENYRLYVTNRREHVSASRMGPSGETLRALLVVGLHSGTLPKLYDRLRRAAQREEARAPGRDKVDGEVALARFRSGIEAVGGSVRRFAERELLRVLEVHPGWQHGRLEVERVDLGRNRIRVRLVSSAFGGDACELTLEQLGGMLVAGISRKGFVAELAGDDLIIFENALAYFYHRAEVDLVREQLDRELPDHAQYEIEDEALIVWPEADYLTELSYRLVMYRPRPIVPRVRGTLHGPLPVIESSRILYRQQRLSLLVWERAWQELARQAAPRLVLGHSLLPRSGGRLAESSVGLRTG